MATGDISYTKYRFPDDEKEPCIMLQLIFGSNEKPSVLLEEAVQPLHNIVPYITMFAYTAKERVAERPEKPANGLSIDESAAIVLYTMEWEPHENSLYYILNSTLRTEDPEKLKPWFLYLKLILTALSRLPSVTSRVYWGVNSEIEGESHKYQIGKDVICWEFSSYSQKRDTPEKEQFLGEDGSRTLFILDCINGKDISEHSYFQKDQEILLLPATTLRVTNKKRSKSGARIIYLKEIEPSPFLLKPVSTKEEVNALDLRSGAISQPQYTRNPQIPTTEPKYFNLKLSEYIARCKPNSEVYLIGTQFNEKDMEIIVEELMTKRRCRELFLRESEITSEGACVIAKALPDNHTLERLFLSYNKIDDQGAQMLAKALETNVTLKHLCLGYNSINDEGVGYLSDALKLNKTLTHLWLPSNNIGDRGLQSLADALSVNKTLQVLSLEWNNFSGGNGMNVLENMLTVNKTLTVLNLNRCELLKRDIVRLKKVAKAKKDFELAIH